MQPALKRFTNLSSSLRQGATALLLTTPMLLSFELSAQANFATTVRGIFTGNTGQGARGNARGASIRDRRCGVAAPVANSGDLSSALSTTSSTSSTEQLILLVPNTGQTLATTTVPEIFVYIPPHTSSPAEQIPGTTPAPATTIDQSKEIFRKTSLNLAPVATVGWAMPTVEKTTFQKLLKIDLDDIDSVVDENLQDEVEQAQQSELLLELQFDGTTRYYSLPSEALIAKLQAPENTAFEIGEVSSLEVRLVCRRVDLTSLSQTAATESSYSTESEVFVDLQRVEPSQKLTAAIATSEPDEVYQAYLENGLWFEMVAALAAHPQSAEWAALLQELEIPAVDLTPQPLIPVTH